MSTGTLRLIEHSVPDLGAEPMATAMHAELAVELQDLHACLPEMPAVALYYSGGQFHAFWPEQLPASVRSRVREHLETHYLLGDLQACEGFYWAEDFEAGRARLHHLDEASDRDIEPRTIRRCLMRLDPELDKVLSQPEAMEIIAAIAERESIDIAVVCALAARHWPHPASVSVPGQTTWSNASELTALDEPEGFSFLQRQFGDVCFSVVVPGPDVLEALLAPELESLLELDFTGAQDPDSFLALETLFGTGDGTEELTELEILFTEPGPQAIPDAPNRVELEDETSLEALFSTFEAAEALLPFELVEQPVLDSVEDDSFLLESLFAATEPDAQLSELTLVESAVLFEPEVLSPTEEQESEISIEMLFAENDGPVFEPTGTSTEAFMELDEVPSLELLFSDFSEDVWSEATPVEASNAELATGVETLFAEAPNEDPATGDFEALFAEVPNGELATGDFELLFAKAADEELAAGDFELLFAEMDLNLPMVQSSGEPVASRDELVVELGNAVELDTPLVANLEMRFEAAEPVENELANLEHCVAILGEAGTGLFAGVIAFATHLDWLTDAPLSEAIAAVEPYLDRMHCRMLHCPQPEETVEALKLSLATVPDNLLVKVGLGLPTGHSLFALGDAAGRRLFFHRQPGSAVPVLVYSWSWAADSSYQLDWRAERFELLWSNQLRPHVRVEALNTSHEPLLALS